MDALAYPPAAPGAQPPCLGAAFLSDDCLVTVSVGDCPMSSQRCVFINKPFYIAMIAGMCEPFMLEPCLDKQSLAYTDTDLVSVIGGFALVRNSTSSGGAFPLIDGFDFGFERIRTQIFQTPYSLYRLAEPPPGSTRGHHTFNPTGTAVLIAIGCAACIIFLTRRRAVQGALCVVVHDGGVVNADLTRVRCELYESPRHPANYLALANYWFGVSTVSATTNELPGHVGVN